jgi:hypothetical protein
MPGRPAAVGPDAVQALQRSAGNRCVSRAIAGGRRSPRLLARHPLQDWVDEQDRHNVPPGQERAATQLGRSAAQLDRLALRFSPWTRTSLLTLLDTLDDPEATHRERLEDVLLFLAHLQEGLIVWDRGLGRYRGNLRSTPEFQAMWADSWLRLRFQAAFVDEQESLDNAEELQLALIAGPIIIGALTGVARGLGLGRVLRRGRAWRRVVRETIAYAGTRPGKDVVAAGTFEPATNRVFFATNRSRLNARGWHPLLQNQERLRHELNPTDQERAGMRALLPGQHHAEMLSLNDALWARQDALGRPLTRMDMRTTVTDIRWLRGSGRLMAAHRCPGCIVGTEDAPVTPAVAGAEGEWFRREMAQTRQETGRTRGRTPPVRR